MADRGDAREVVVTGEGPILVSGPVEIVLPDGSRVRSERPVTAICACRRSRRAPFCDTSHRRKVRQTDDPPDVEEDRVQQDTAPAVRAAHAAARPGAAVGGRDRGAAR